LRESSRDVRLIVNCPQVSRGLWINAQTLFALCFATLTWATAQHPQVIDPLLNVPSCLQCDSTSLPDTIKTNTKREQTSSPCWIYDRYSNSLWPANFQETIPWPTIPLIAPGEINQPKEDITKESKLFPSANLTVQIQSDFAWFDQDPQNIATVGNIPDGAFFRRARFGVFGELYKTVEYRLEFDFASEARPRFLDVWIALTDLPIIRNVIVGHFFEPFSLERYSPNRFITFNERSLADTFAPARNMGMMVYGNAFDKRVTWAAGAFRVNSDDFGDHVSNRSGWAGTFHATCLPWFEEPDPYTRYLLHLGASYSYRSEDDRPLRFASRPSIRLRQQGVGGVPVFVDTGPIDDAFAYQLIGAEAAWVHGPWSIQGEWIAAPVRRGGRENPFFHAGYVYGSWFLTGESRSYSPTSILGRFREGIFQRVTPRSNVFDRSGGGRGGIGAWEIAARWNYINLNSAGVEGGFMDEVTVGMNWYLNAYTRVSFNYVRPILRDPIDGVSSADMYSLRFQFEF
jgi:phosphate-selective porin OprO/OprP